MKPVFVFLFDVDVRDLIAAQFRRIARSTEALSNAVQRTSQIVSVTLKLNLPLSDISPNAIFRIDCQCAVFEVRCTSVDFPLQHTIKMC